MTDRLQEGGVTLEIAAPAQLGHLIADRQRLKQILIKILTNAVNFAPEGSVVSMKCWRETSDFVFSVSDSGCGMSPDLVSSAFDRFSTSAKGGKRSGPGLGLSIVQSFVNLHQGDVKIDSEPGRGTTPTADDRRRRMSAEPTPVIIHLADDAATARFGEDLLLALQVMIYPLVSWFRMGGFYNTSWAILLVHCIFGMPVLTLLFRNYYVSVPQELFKAARIDGGGFWRIFLQLMLPMATPMLIV
eukprot:gene37277-42219_t